MNYELISVDIFDAPTYINNDLQIQVPLAYTVGVVGDTYGFYKVVTGQVMTCDTSLTALQIKQQATIEGQNYVATNFPPTP